MEGGAYPLVALDPDATLVGFDSQFAEGKPQSNACPVSLGAHAGLGKLFKDTVVLIGRDAAARIGDGELHSIRQLVRGDADAFSDGSLPPKQDPFLKQEDGEWQPNPCLIQKSDGAANYATTDLATLAYRVATWNPDEIVYVTDGRQQLHLRQLFAIFQRWHPQHRVRLAHVWFGSILGEDGKPFRTRSGEVIRLADLLDEAEQRAFDLVTAKNPDLDTATRREIARVVGLGAVKYADLLPNRQSDYVFSWDKMLALNGNTAPYLQF